MPPEVASGNTLKEILGCDGNPFACLAEALVAVTFPAAHGCRLWRDADTVNITTNNPVPGLPFDWDMEEFDTDGMHDSVTNKSRIVIPSFAVIPRGVWRIHAQLSLIVSIGGQVNITKNGSAISFVQGPSLTNLYAGTAGAGTGISSFHVNMSGLIIPAAGDFFEVRTINQSASSQEVGFDSQSRATDCFFEAQYIGKVAA